jgi:hypothetical protein
MATDTRTPSLRMTLSEPAPSEVAVGARLVVRVQVACAAGCDRSGMLLQVTAPDGAVTAHAINRHDGAVSESSDIALEIPAQVGEHVWGVRLPAHDAGDMRHDDNTLAVVIRAKPLTTSLAVWAVPSPATAGECFAIKVGAKSSADCDLAGRRIEVRDAAGAVVATGCLGDTPWPGTSALFWTDVPLRAPAEPGLETYSAQFDAAELDLPHLELPHLGACSVFTVAVVEPPAHVLTVKVIAKETAAPIEDAQIRLGPHRAATDAAGLAEVRMPKGRYELFVWKAGYEAPAVPLDIDADAFIQVEALALPEEDQDAHWKM